MTKKEFNKQRWGVGMRIKYTDESSIVIEADVISVDFDDYKVGIDIMGDIVYLPCEQCEITKDFSPLK